LHLLGQPNIFLAQARVEERREEEKREHRRLRERERAEGELVARPKLWANFKTPIGIFVQTAWPTCEVWTNLVHIRLWAQPRRRRKARGRPARRAALHGDARAISDCMVFLFF
jgi:hypothetical protein